MSQVLVGVGGVDDQHVAVLVIHVNVGIVHSAALGVGDHAVLCTAGLHSSHVAGQGILHKCQTVGTFDQQTAHVGNVEDAAAATGCQMLGHDAAGVLDGHLPTAEVHHGGAGSDVCIKQYGTLQFAHCKKLLYVSVF